MKKKEIGRGKNHPSDRQNLVNNLKTILFRQQKKLENRKSIEYNIVYQVKFSFVLVDLKQFVKYYLVFKNLKVLLGCMSNFSLIF